MKNHFYLILFILFCTIPAIAQTDYKNLWERVEKKEVEQHYHQLLKEVDEIYELADKEENDQELVRAFFYKVKYDLLLKKDIEQEVYQDFIKEINQRETPIKQIFSSVLAESLEDYVRRNNSRIQGRSQTDKEEEEYEFQFWTSEHFKKEILKHYKTSLQNPDQLAELKEENFSYLLKHKEDYKNYRTSLLDVLAMRFQNYLILKANQTDKDKTDFWKASSDFIKTAESTTQEISYVNELKLLFQQMEKIHAKNPLTLLTYELDRLEFAFDSDKEKIYLYEKSLLNLKNNYSGELEQNWISLTLASFYEQYADKQKQPDFYQKSLNELQAVLKLKDSPKLVAIAKSIQKNIESQDLKIMTEDYGSPDKPAKALVKFRNVDTLYLSVYTDLKPEIKKGLVKADSVWKLLDSAKLVKEKKYVLPQVKKGFEYSSEFLLPKLPQGHYLFLFSSKQNPDFNKDIYAWREINFSQLAFFQSWNGKDLQFYVSDRESGKPISEAEVDFSFKTSSKSQKKYQLKTNSEGLATISPENINNSVDISGFVSKEKDSLFFGNQPYLWKQAKEKEHKKSYSINSYLLTDRKIFRPGQTLYFKGFVAFQKDKKQQTADKFPVKISLYDSDHNLVEEKQLITNKMGSVEGEFKLPKSGLTGKYSLEITEEVENGKWKKYVDKFKKERINIQVEEYKRPRFEVKFEDLAETYFLKDSVQLQANAKAFFGGNLSNAEVRYTLKRSLEYTPQMDYQFYRTYNKAETLKTGELKTDENGHFQIDFIAEPQNEISKETDPIYNYTLEVEVTDINGETHTTEKSVKISYSGINAELLSPEEVILGKENEAVLSFKDLNQTSTAAKGELKIYQYEVPKRVFKERVWEIPEYQMISKEDFRKYYPYEVYDSLDLKENWTKKLVKTLEVSKAEKWNLKYDEIEELKPGEYLLEFKGEGVKNLPLKIQKTISISAPEKSKELTEFVKSTFEETGKSNSPKIKAEFEASEDLYILWEVANDKNWKTQKVLELKKGKNIFEIDFPKNSQLLGSQYFYIKANDYFSKGNMIDRKQEKAENLQFEIEHFTDKLHPGNKEVWKLKLLDNQGKPVKAEVLASMYDASLDSFIKENTDWNINLQETPWSYYIPRPNLSNIIGYSFGKKTSFGFNIPRKIYFTQSFFNTTDLETFGYNFVYTQRAQTEYLEKLENKFPFFDENTKEAKVSGVVVDQDGLPIPGTQIQLNSKKKTTTDLEGRFTISAKFGDTLQVSSIGFKDILIKVFTSNIKVQVKEGVPLEEVAVSYSQVSAPQALAGRVNGLTSNADLNETSKHTEKALDASSSVNLFIVDGKPMTKEEVSQINADEIIQIDILKAEEAVKLYGNQANNGAAVIITKSSLEDLQEIKPRENLQETAFFYPNLKTDKKGNINIEFETPEALTRWKFQAFAHDKNLQQAYIMRHAITQKDLNIIPNFPRFFRAGDTIQISAKVNNLSEKALNGQVLLKFTDEIKQKEINLTLNSEKSNVKNFVLEAKENAETYWEIIIPEGVEALRYEISAKAENFTDAETNIIPVLSQREFLTESLPLWVEPQQEKSFVLENLQNQTSKSLKNHKLIFDFTARPIWTAIEAMPYLTQETYASADRIFDLYYSYTLGERILKENKDIAELVKSWKNSDEPENRWEQNKEMRNLLLKESPWLKTAQSQKEQQQNLAKLLDKENTSLQRQEQLNRLLQMQLPSGGFPWFQGGRESLAISTHILIGMGKLGIPEDDEILQEKYEEITEALVKYLDDQFLTQFVDSKGKIDQYLGINSLYYLYARSFFERNQENVKAYQKKAFEKLEKEWRKMNFHQKVIFALVAQKYERKDLAKNILKVLEETTVLNSEEGMYWKENTQNFGWYESSILSHALAIEVFADADAKKETLNALKTWLIKQKQTQSWTNSRATLGALQALLIDAEDWKNDSNQSEIWLGNKKLEWKSTAGKAGYFKKEFSPEEINSDMAEVKIINKGSSPQFGGLYWQYFEKVDQVKSAKTDELEVEKSIFVNRNSKKGKTLVSTEKTAVKVGDKITIRLKIKAKADFEFMHLKDARIAGAEPLETLSGYRSQDGLYFYQTHKDVASHFFFDRLPKGNYVFEYEVVVNNAGNFSAGLSQLQSLYVPEFSSQTQGKRIKFEEMEL